MESASSPWQLRHCHLGANLTCISNYNCWQDLPIDLPALTCKMMSMKSAYELAMERLNKSAPAVKLSEEQKKEIAELDSLYASKVAQREIFLKGEIAKAEGSGDFEALEQLQKQLSSERKTLQAELEEKKDEVRKRKAAKS
jgi:hypothetical protein